MMGHAHAITGAAAWVAVTATGLPATGWWRQAPAAVILGAVVCAGAALLPDADHPDATIAHSAPGMGTVAGTVGKLSGGHRHATHSILAVAAFMLGAWGISHWTATPHGWSHPVPMGAAVAVLLCATFAVKVLRLVRSWILAWLVGAALAAAVALWAPADPTWLVVCVGIGVVVHLLGDFLTVEGVPFLWPLNPRPPRVLADTPVGRHLWMRNGYFALPLLGHAGSMREILLTVPVGLYALWGVGVSVVALTHGL